VSATAGLLAWSFESCLLVWDYIVNGEEEVPGDWPWVTQAGSNVLVGIDLYIQLCFWFIAVLDEASNRSIDIAFLAPI
jgi:hypothetical protein